MRLYDFSRERAIQCIGQRMAEQLTLEGFDKEREKIERNKNQLQK